MDLFLHMYLSSVPAWCPHDIFAVVASVPIYVHTASALFSFLVFKAVADTSSSFLQKSFLVIFGCNIEFVSACGQQNSTWSIRDEIVNISGLFCFSSTLSTTM